MEACYDYSSPVKDFDEGMEEVNMAQPPEPLKSTPSKKKEKPVVIEDDITTGEALRRKLWIDTFTRIAALQSTRVDVCEEWANEAVDRYDKWLASQDEVEEFREN